ncbi:MAG: PilZ domain-containing protein [Candidatus Omnitrophota bacterium]
MELDIKARRCFPRMVIRAPIRFQVRGQAEAYQGLCDNISAGGLGFSCDRFIAPLSTLMLEINILSRVLRPVGKVAWAQDLPRSFRSRLGVEFIEMDPAEKNYLGDYIGLHAGQL